MKAKPQKAKELIERHAGLITNIGVCIVCFVFVTYIFGGLKPEMGDDFQSNMSNCRLCPREFVESEMLNKCYSQCNKFVVYGRNSTLPVSYDYVAMCNMICDMVRQEVIE